MSLRFIVNIGDKDKDDLEIEFWPDRKKAQAREITRQGVVHVDHEMNMQKVIDGLLGALKESREERKAEATNTAYSACDKCGGTYAYGQKDAHTCAVSQPPLEQQLVVVQQSSEIARLMQALETERASHASDVAGAQADIDKLEDEKEALIIVAHAAYARVETHMCGELTTKRDTREEWAALRAALTNAGYKEI
jgi:hypothetical protein